MVRMNTGDEGSGSIFAAQAGDPNINATVEGRSFGTGQQIQDAIPVEYLVGVADQDAKQVELAGSQRHGSAVSRQRMCIEVEPEVAKLNDPRQRPYGFRTPGPGAAPRVLGPGVHEG